MVVNQYVVRDVNLSHDIACFKSAEFAIKQLSRFCKDRNLSHDDYCIIKRTIDKEGTISESPLEYS